MILLITTIFVILNIEKIETAVKKFVARTSLWYMSQKMQEALNKQYEKEEAWRQGLRNLQRRTRVSAYEGMTSNLAIAERLLHAPHHSITQITNGVEFRESEETMMERIYGPLSKEVEL